MTTATQTIVVQDTTAPTNPVLSSPSHATGVWSTAPAVTVEALGSSDVCSGVDAFSYSWSSGTPQTPDYTTDSTTFIPEVPAQNVIVSPGSVSGCHVARAMDTGAYRRSG